MSHSNGAGRQPPPPPPAKINNVIVAAVLDSAQNGVLAMIRGLQYVRHKLCRAGRRPPPPPHARALPCLMPYRPTTTVCAANIVQPAGAALALSVVLRAGAQRLQRVLQLFRLPIPLGHAGNFFFLLGAGDPLEPHVRGRNPFPHPEAAVGVWGGSRRHGPAGARIVAPFCSFLRFLQYVFFA